MRITWLDSAPPIWETTPTPFHIPPKSKSTSNFSHCPRLSTTELQLMTFDETHQCLQHLKADEILLIRWQLCAATANSQLLKSTLARYCGIKSQGMLSATSRRWCLSTIQEAAK